MSLEALEDLSKPDKTPTGDQLKEIGVHSTALLNTLIQIAEPFQLLNDFDRIWEKSLKISYVTPPVPISNRAEINSAPYYFVMVRTKRYLKPAGAGGDQFRQKEVNAGLYLQVSENQPLIPVALLEGTEAKAGEVTCTKVTTLGSSRNEEVGQLAELNDAQEIADSIKKYFADKPDVGATLNGQEGHVVSFRKKDRKVVSTIPQ